jgi:tRNA uridine 5-carboxymethylaminomethyl modification enzyme
VIEASEINDSVDRQEEVHPLATKLAREQEIYAGYRLQAERLRHGYGKWDEFRIPMDVDLDRVPVKAEVRERLMAARPTTVGEVLRIPGVTEADAATLVAFLTAQATSVSRETSPSVDEDDDA